MASDAQQPEQTSAPMPEAQADAPLANGTSASEHGSPAIASPKKKAALPPEAVIADLMASSTPSAEDEAAWAAADASAEPTCQSVAAVGDAETDIGQRMIDISLSQDLDGPSAAPAAAQEAPPADADASAAGSQPALLPVSAAIQLSPSLDEPLPASTAHIDSDAFFQDDDESKFTLDEEEEPPAGGSPAAAALSTQEEAQRAAQDLEDEEIQRRLQATREAAAADAARSVSPPVHNRPMSPPPGSAPRSPLPPPGVEPPEFRGLLYYDGIDSVGRPVVVVNARADAMLQPKMRNQAMDYMKRRLEPIVYQGPYVLVMVASGHQGDTSSKLPAMWLIRAYRSLTRPYKKNVKYIVLVRPSAMLSAMMVVLRPFLSLKAARKLHKVDSLLDIDAVTGGDVKAEQLGARFLQEELGVEPGASLTPTAAPAPPPGERASSLDEEVQLGSF